MIPVAMDLQQWLAGRFRTYPVGQVADAADERLAPHADEDVVAELLVEEVSIDGMCGVY
jgi:mycofactocin precursor